MKLTEKQKWFLNYLRTKTTDEYISPTEVGREYGISKGKKGYHSSIASPTLLKLFKMGLVERNNEGHYKIKP